MSVTPEQHPQNRPQTFPGEGPAVAPREPTRRRALLAATAAIGTALTTTGLAQPAAAAAAPGPGRGGASVNDRAISPLDPEFRWRREAGADNTFAVQGAIDKAMRAPGGQVVLPAGDIHVRALAIDYRDFPAQPVNGEPYGYPGPKITGAGMRQTRIHQIAGSTADIFTVTGKTGQQSGPANNNKATGVTLADFQLAGTPGGGHGLYLRSLVNCEFRNLWIQKTGKAGIFRERETFVSGVNDEYSYANSWTRVKIVAPGTWGVQDSGLASIGGSMSNVEVISPVEGGFLLAPTNMTLLDCQSIGGKVGLRAVRNQNRSSVNSGLTLINFRSEGASGGYEILLEAGTSYLMVNPNFFPTSGASCLGVGLLGAGPDSYVRNLTVIGGFFGISASRFPAQRAAVFGPDSRNTRLIHPTIELSGGVTETQTITDDGYRTEVELPGANVDAAAGYTSHRGVAGTVPTPAAGQVNEGWESVDGRWQKVAVLPDGRRVVIAS